VTILVFELLIALFVLTGKWFNIKNGGFLLITLILALGFHFGQTKIIKASFLSHYARKFPELGNKPTWLLVLTMAAPMFSIMAVLWTALVLIGN
jgi:hypothetical protein